MRRPLLKLALVTATAVAAGVAAEKVAARRLRSRLRPATDHLYTLPADVTHRTLAAHDGGAIHLVERGEGRPLVLLHGVTLAAAIWSPQLHQMAGTPERPGFRVIAVDLRGHGGSHAGTDGYGLPVLARDLATVLTELDLHDALVAGHSMGGMTLMEFCAAHPDVLAERVAGVAFVATAAFAPVHPLMMERVKVLSGVMLARLDDGRALPARRFTGGDLSLFACRAAFGKDPSAAAIEQVRACLESMDDDAMARSWLGILDHDVRSKLGRLDVPAEIVVGSHDLLTPVSAARAIAKLLPDAGFHLLPDAGHQVMQERPDELARILRDLDARTRTGAHGVTAAG